MQPVSPKQDPSASSGGANKVAMIVAITALVVAILTLGLLSVVYGMVSNLATTPPSSGSPPIRVTQRIVGAGWELEVVEVPTPHALTATTLLIRWPGNATPMSPPGQVPLEGLKTTRNGIQYLPVNGPSQTDLRLHDAIDITSGGAYVAGLHLTIADGQSLLWQGNLITITGSGGPQTIGISQTSGASNWQLQLSNVPTTHAVTTTTLLIRWSGNATIVSPPGQISFQALKTQTAGVQYVPVSGPSQTDLRVLDVITIAKGGVYVSGMQITIADGSTILWQGNLA